MVVVVAKNVLCVTMASKNHVHLLSIQNQLEIEQRSGQL